MNRLKTFKINIPKWLLPGTAGLVLFIFLLSLLLPFLVKPAFLERFLTEAFEQKTDFLLTLEQPRFSILPSPSFQFSNVKVWQKQGSRTGGPLLSADRVSCRLYLFALLLKRIEFAKVRFEGMSLELPVTETKKPIAKRTVEVRDASLLIDNVRTNCWMRFQMEGKWLNERPNLVLRGKAKADFAKGSLTGTAVQADLSVKPMSFSEFLKWGGKEFGEQVDQGTLELTAKISKLENSSLVAATGQFVLNEFIYRTSADTQTASISARYGLDLDAVFNLDTQVISLQKANFATPFTVFQGKGSYDFKGKKLEDVQWTSSSIDLDRLPTYLPMFAKLLPFNFGFSGEGAMDFKCRGNWEQLSVDAKVDLTKALLTYSRYFVKPKGVPFVAVTGELAVRHGVELDGDVDVNLKQTRMKASLVKLNMASKIGEVTFVTNLIPLEGWQEYLPTFSEYEFSGGVKFFANAKGDFSAINHLLAMYHAAFNQASARSKSGTPLFQNLNGSIDGGPLDLETKGLQFDFGTAHFDVQTKMFFHKDPQMVIRIDSPALDVRNFVLQLQKAFQVLAIPEQTLDWAALGKTVQALIQPDTKLENFSLQFNYQNKQIGFDRLDFDIYGGHVGLTGQVNWASKEPVYGLKVEAQKISLARMLRRDVSKPIEGNLFLVAQVQGEGLTNEALKTKLKGEGSISVTNGEFHTFDVLGSLGAVAQFTGLGKFVSGTTQFSDFSGNFQIASGKVQTDHILIHSNDFDVDTSGEIDFDGNLNFRLDTVLSNQLSQKIDRHLSVKDRLGPIPLILTGKIDSPRLRPDPALIQDFVRNLIGRQLGKILADQDLFKSLPFKPGQGGAAQQASSAPSGGSSRQEAKPGEKLVETGLTLLESLLQKRE